MYINFQQNGIKTQVIAVLTSLFSKKLQVDEFAITNSNF